MRIVYGVGFFLFVVKEVLLQSVVVGRDMLRRRSRIEPVLVRLPLRAATDVEIAVLASSITITPGTLTIGIAPATEDGPASLLIHAVYGADPDSVLAGLRDMERRLLLASRGNTGEEL